MVLLFCCNHFWFRQNMYRTLTLSGMLTSWIFFNNACHMPLQIVLSLSYFINKNIGWLSITFSKTVTTFNKSRVTAFQVMLELTICIPTKKFMLVFNYSWTMLYSIYNKLKVIRTNSNTGSTFLLFPKIYFLFNCISIYKYIYFHYYFLEMMYTNNKKKCHYKLLKTSYLPFIFLSITILSNVFNLLSISIIYFYIFKIKLLLVHF